MYLVQILLPLYDNNHYRFPHVLYRDVQKELTGRFGGLTAYSRAPAEGLWKESAEAPTHDEIVIYEVMVKRIAPKWWRRYRSNLESIFQQDRIVIRAQEIRML